MTSSPAAGHREFALNTGAIIPFVVKRVSRIDFNPVQPNSDVTVGPSLTSTTCAATLSISTLPSSIAYATQEVTEGEPSVFTVTTVVTATPTSTSA
ncbi:unnamed protein product [Ambrosiozyma monospora]|uniref:Unnamed protein product n=1 Tax=Ambrosiozyma monospora TaxID=43982 RepID=A0ACB5TXS1_AMBMO|nr:unnamed protein product [Ambrosiozyma monospora]